jgi:hypothetical protein
MTRQHKATVSSPGKGEPQLLPNEHRLTKYTYWGGMRFARYGFTAETAATT